MVNNAGLTPYVVVRTILPGIDRVVLDAMVVLTMAICETFYTPNDSMICKAIMQEALVGHETTAAAGLQPYLSEDITAIGRDSTMLVSAMRIMMWFRPGTPVLPENAAALTRHCSSSLPTVHGQAILAIHNLCEGSRSNIDLFVDAGVIAATVQLFKPGICPNTQCEAVLFFTSAVGKCTKGYKAARETDAVRMLLLMLRPCNDTSLRVKASSALGLLLLGDNSNEGALHESSVMLKAVPHLVEMRFAAHHTPDTRDAAKTLLVLMGKLKTVYANAISSQIETVLQLRPI